MTKMYELIGHTNLVFITLDTLRFDAAQKAWRNGKLQTITPYLGESGWECRHTPANFTYAAHHAFFAGFLPTKTTPGPHPRLFAAEFEGSLTTDENTFQFREATLPQALSARGYRSICIGGTGFFNQKTALSRVLPDLFDEAHWSPQLSISDPKSHINQIALAIERLQATNGLFFLFINIAAIHQPNWFYGSNMKPDTLETHTAALVESDKALFSLFRFIANRGDTFCIICSDHGTAYGEGGYMGHRCNHEVVWNVPYAEFML